MERLTAGRAHALGESLRTVDLASSHALTTHATWLQEAEHILREANIQLAAPHLHTVTVLALRDRIDRLLDIVPRAQPVAQTGDD